MIENSNDLKFYIAADRLMNGLPEKRSITELIRNCILGGGISDYLFAMRMCAFYQNTIYSKYSLRHVFRFWWLRRFNRLGIKYGFSIGMNSLGYGTILPHYGTIVVNGEAKIGNYAVLHTCTCVAGGKKTIGDFFYLSTGSQVVGSLLIGDGVTVSAHSLVNKSFGNNLLIVGAPADIKLYDYPLWVVKGGSHFIRRVELVENLKQKMYS